MPYLARSVSLLALVSAAACSAPPADTADTSAEIANTPAVTQPAAPQVDRGQLLDDLRILASDEMEGREAGTEGNARARAYIIERFEAIGVSPLNGSYTADFTYVMRGDDEGGEHPGVNIMGVIEGTSDSNRTMVVTAHYDHEGMRDGQIWNGADDNASGVAALLAVAEEFAANPPEHDVIFAAVDAEEKGLHGAYAFVANPPIDLDDITFNLNLDMVAYSEERILWVVGTYHYPALLPVAEAVASRASISLPTGFDEPTEERGGDWTYLTDSAAFHDQGIPFIYMGVDFHPYYHEPSDTYENMTLDFFQDAADSIVDFARESDRQLDAIGEASGR